MRPKEEDEASRDHYFEKLTSPNEWAEISNGTIIFRFVEMSQSPNGTILKSMERDNFYVKLTNTSASFGETPDDIGTLFEYGGWVGQDEYQELSSKWIFDTTVRTWKD